MISSRGALLEEIETLVHRHKQALCRGYRAETTVVTYCRNRKDCVDKSKLRILPVKLGKVIHGQILKKDIAYAPFTSSELVKIYRSCGALEPRLLILSDPSTDHQVDAYLVISKVFITISLLSCQ
ncbi:hypothetical protein A4A49_22773 [Nicotiana attenuata]|uniref:Uncharacterized protein n=1 Tax=Nicotiana attenuata TaxID=49451 RepID=A0A314LFC6_NICAT|nr:hypothetical protein A4A49_22773 [Nicotiana attenuata]